MDAMARWKISTEKYKRDMSVLQAVSIVQGQVQKVSQKMRCFTFLFVYSGAAFESLPTGSCETSGE
jgi:hypothetical protein